MQNQVSENLVEKVNGKKRELVFRIEIIKNIRATTRNGDARRGMK